MTSDINNPLSRIAFCSQWPYKGWSQLLTRSNGEGARKLEGDTFKFVMPAPKQEKKLLKLSKPRMNCFCELCPSKK